VTPLLPATPRRCDRSWMSRRVRRPKPESLPERRTAADGATRRRTRATGVSASTRRSVAGPAQRGANALMIDEILTAVAPRAARPAEIRKALQDKGVGISFASIRHALGQLEARNAAEQVGDSKTWRHRGAGSDAARSS
jgi:hypothetical protein